MPLPSPGVSRLTELGCDDIELPATPLPRMVDPGDALLLKADTFNLSWLEVGKPVSLRNLLASAGRQGQSPAEAARRLTAFGCPVPADHPLPDTPDTRDSVLIRTGPGGNGEWMEWGAAPPTSPRG